MARIVSDKKLLEEINLRYKEGDVVKGKYTIINYLKLPYLSDADKKASREYLKRFMEVKLIARGVYEIIKIRTLNEVKEYDQSFKTQNKKKQPTKKQARGYNSDIDFLYKVKCSLSLGVHYKGYSELCRLLDVPHKKNKSQQIKQKEDWERFFTWREIAIHDWIITEIYDEPEMDMTHTRSIYGDNASCIIAKEIIEHEHELRKQGKATIVDKNGSFELMIASKDMNKLMGMSNYTDYTPLTVDEIAKIDKKHAESYGNDDSGDKESFYSLIKRDAVVTRGVYMEYTDIDMFIKQISSKQRSVVSTALNNFKYKNIVYYAYTDIFTDLKTRRSDVLLRHKELLSAVKEIRQYVMDKYNITDERMIFYIDKGAHREKYFTELNMLIRDKLGIVVFRGYYIFIRPQQLKKYYEKKNIKGLPLDIFRKDLYDKVYAQQHIGAAKINQRDNNLIDKGHVDLLPEVGDNYDEISDALMDMLIPYNDMDENGSVDMFLPMETLEETVLENGTAFLSRMGL